jgi:hypothetical protein
VNEGQKRGDRGVLLSQNEEKKTEQDLIRCESAWRFREKRQRGDSLLILEINNRRRKGPMPIQDWEGEGRAR